MRPRSGNDQNGWYMLPSMFPYATAIVIYPYGTPSTYAA
jgi:hypothetical protein